MTLTTVPRYDPGGVSEIGGHAVVVGAGMAGLCTARILADAFEEVTLIDQDPQPDEPSTRRGVPQSQHIHNLLEAGRKTLEDLFPGFSEELLSAGAVVLDIPRDGRMYVEGDFIAAGPQRRPIYCATRPLIEHTVRQRVTELDGVQVRSNCQWTDYLLDGDSTTVDGVVVKSQRSEPEELAADQVVDATGRTSRTASWLEDHGYPSPPVDEVTINVTYTTTFVDRPPADRRGLLVMPAPGQPDGGVFVPVEDDRWVMTLWSMHSDDPPTDPESVLEYTADLPIPYLRRLLDEHSWRKDAIAHYPFPSNLRRRYEDLDRFPDGLLVLGDAIASFNPIYGQGMTVAALEAVQLHHCLAANGRDDLPHRFFDRIKETVDIAWNMAAGGDHQFPETEGPKPRGTDILNWYLSRLFRKAHTDGELFDAFSRVQMMEQPPTTLLHPAVVWRVFKPTG